MSFVAICKKKMSNKLVIEYSTHWLDKELKALNEPVSYTWQRRFIILAYLKFWSPKIWTQYILVNLLVQNWIFQNYHNATSCQIQLYFYSRFWHQKLKVSTGTMALLLCGTFYKSVKKMFPFISQRVLA